MPLTDAALDRIAENLARLDLSPALHLRIAVAVVGPLLGEATDGLKSNAGAEFDLKQPRPKPAAAHKPASHGGAKSAHARPGGKPGEAAARARQALDLAPTLSASALAREAGCAPATAKRVIKARKANGGEPQPRSLGAAAARDRGNKAFQIEKVSPDARALAWLEAALERGPVEAALVDDMIARGRLHSASVERMKAEMKLVAVRIATPRGATVHLARPAQAQALDAIVAQDGLAFERRRPAARRAADQNSQAEV